MDKQAILQIPNHSNIKQDLLQALSQKGIQASLLEETDDIAEDQSILIVAFPEVQGDKNQITQNILTDTFAIVKKFVQARMRKKSGQIIFLLAAEANGISHGKTSSQEQSFAWAIQGGMTGFAKTISKEYGKKGLSANCLYIDWDNVDLSQIAHSIDLLSEANTTISGQVLAIDGGKGI